MITWFYTGLFGFLIADAVVYTNYWTMVTGNDYTPGKRFYIAFVSMLFGYIAFTIHMMIVIVWTSQKY